MNITIHSIKFDADQRLKDFINAKLSKVLVFDEEIMSAEVFLKLDKSDNSENKVVEVKLSIPKGEYFAKKQCKTFEEALVLDIEAIKRQISKSKEKK